MAGQSHLGDPEYWRKGAKEIRALAEEVSLSQVSGSCSSVSLLFCRQSFFGASRQLLIVFGNPKHFALHLKIGDLRSDGASLFGAPSPMVRIVNRYFGHVFALHQGAYARLCDRRQKRTKTL